jgi:hypothetical protein
MVRQNQIDPKEEKNKKRMIKLTEFSTQKSKPLNTPQNKKEQHPIFLPKVQEIFLDEKTKEKKHMVYVNSVPKNNEISKSEQIKMRKPETISIEKPRVETKRITIEKSGEMFIPTQKLIKKTKSSYISTEDFITENTW